MFLYISLGILLMGSAAFLLWLNSGVKLPDGAEQTISKAVNAPIPNLVTGKTGIAKSGNLDIWYERMEPSGERKGTVLLVMGHNSTAMLWTSHFYQPIIDAGYEVIRYDNRDVGLSTWVKNYSKKNPYTLEDMAKDGIAVLDDDGVKKAHIIGVSMGGMIAQRLALSHSDRVLSLTSIMSTGYMMDPEMPPVPKWFGQNFVKFGIKYLSLGSKTGGPKFFVAVMQTLRGDGPYELDVKTASEIMLYETQKRKGFNKKAIYQQAKAIEASGSRLEELGQIKMPTLIIHGKADPLIIFAHAEKYAPLIPHADTLFIDGMGHDLPALYMSEVHEAIFRNVKTV